MFQSFDVTASPEQGPARLTALRAEIHTKGIDGFLIPRADMHQGEDVAERDARLAWLTGFTGSAGFCAVLPDIAGLFVDGRYRVQVRQQANAVFTPVDWPEVHLADWLIEHLPNGGVVGFDAWLHTVNNIRVLTKKLTPHNITLQPVPNLVDDIWTDQPDPPQAPFFVHQLEFAGEPHADKIARLSAALTVPSVVITLPDSIAWLLNIRGADIERNPVPHGCAILHQSGTVDLYAIPGKADAVADHLGDTVKIHPLDKFQDDLAALEGDVQLDPKSCPAAITTLLTDAEKTVTHGDDSCIMPKACKNEAEIAGARAAQSRDAVAMVEFLAWLDAEAPKGGLTEIDVVTALEGFRAATNALRDVSFETICGAGEHGAIVHYRVTEDTNRSVKPGELLLVDSGGQYVDGTTDITRTVIVGTPEAEHIKSYTAVLQGMIAISMARFPTGVTGQQIDALARTPLWQLGRDYAHGTGHGVGSYLSVHEGPQGISGNAKTAFAPGMIVSNEPGYYREGAFGIRIENLIVVQEAAALDGADPRDMLSFDTLTYVPLDRRLIDITVLTRAERAWIDRYHTDTKDLIGDRVSGATADWLSAACAPL